MKITTKKELVEHLLYMADRVSDNDSFGGFIEYNFIGCFDLPELKDDEVFIRASYRVGNTFGQGCMVVVE